MKLTREEFPTQELMHKFIEENKLTSTELQSICMVISPPHNWAETYIIFYWTNRIASDATTGL